MAEKKINLFLTEIFIGENSLTQLTKKLLRYEKEKRKIFFLFDENTEKFCLPVLKKNIFPPSVSPSLIRIKSGEQNKTLSSIEKIWSHLLQHNADRKSVLINLGGGMVCDVGGFAAATFKRGIEFIYIPTTLLAMTDAAIGGKTGINFSELKNQIGTFANPTAVFIYPEFLKTLDERNYTNGFAEIIKHALIADAKFFKKIKSLQTVSENILFNSVKIKCDVVKKDFTENNFRKVLNFGHTIGHALESCLNTKKKTNVLHGEAVAAGMICETYLSHLKSGLPKNEMKEICTALKNKFSAVDLRKLNKGKFLKAIVADKKNAKQKINFSLLSKIGKAKINCSCSEKEIGDALNFYQQLYHD